MENMKMYNYNNDDYDFAANLSIKSSEYLIVTTINVARGMGHGPWTAICEEKPHTVNK